MSTKRVIETLLKLKQLFGSAADLVEAVEEFGLFTGKAFCNSLNPLKRVNSILTKSQAR